MVSTMSASQMTISPTLTWRRLKLLRDNGVDALANVGGTCPPGLVPFNVNHEILRRFQFDAGLDIEAALAALDPDSKVKTVDLVSGMNELKRRLEMLLGTKPDAALDESGKAEVEKEAELLARKTRMPDAGGQLLNAAFAFIGEIFPQKEETAQSHQIAETIKNRLSECLERTETGQLRMSVTLPDESVLDNMAKSLSQILGQGWKP